MNYKKLIPNQELRLKILRLTDFLPDKLVVKLQYRISTGRNLNLKKPKRFTEKLQWYKLYYRNPLMTQCADKYLVRNYIIDKGYEDILVPLYGAYDSVDQIEFEKLPQKFVIKTTNGSQTNILCKSKDKLDIKKTKITVDKWLGKRGSKIGREWAYYNIKPKAICEKYLEGTKESDLMDYKFYCFNGKVKYLELCKERFSDSGVKLGFFDREFRFIDIEVERYKFLDRSGKRIDVKKPDNFNDMIKIAENLSQDFPHVRVDLYNLEGKIYFGELTFYSASGYANYGTFDYTMGEHFKLPI